MQSKLYLKFIGLGIVALLAELIVPVVRSIIYLNTEVYEIEDLPLYFDMMFVYSYTPILIVLILFFLFVHRLFSREEQIHLVEGKFMALKAFVVFFLPLFIFNIYLITQSNELAQAASFYLLNPFEDPEFWTIFKAELLYFPAANALDPVRTFGSTSFYSLNFAVILVELVSNSLRCVKYFFLLLFAITRNTVKSTVESVDLYKQSD